MKHEAKNIGGAGQQLSFVIDEGPKAKVDEIVFDGNEVFSDGTLAGKMKKIKEPGFFNLSWLGGKTTYTEDKWLGGEEDQRGDRGRLEDFYLNHGYVTARIAQPRISYTDGKSGTFKKKPVKLMKLAAALGSGRCSTFVAEEAVRLVDRHPAGTSASGAGDDRAHGFTSLTRRRVLTVGSEKGSGR